MTAPPPTGQAPPRVLLVVAVGVLVVAVPATFVGGWLTGVSWDETYHVMRLTTFLEHGWYLLERDMLGGEPGPWEDQQYVYGPATTLLLHAWSVLWGVEGWGTVSASATAWKARPWLPSCQISPTAIYRPPCLTAWAEAPPWTSPKPRSTATPGISCCRKSAVRVSRNY